MSKSIKQLALELQAVQLLEDGGSNNGLHLRTIRRGLIGLLVAAATEPCTGLDRATDKIIRRDLDRQAKSLKEHVDASVPTSAIRKAAADKPVNIAVDSGNGGPDNFWGLDIADAMAFALFGFPNGADDLKMPGEIKADQAIQPQASAEVVDVSDIPHDGTGVEDVDVVFHYGLGGPGSGITSVRTTVKYEGGKKSIESAFWNTAAESDIEFVQRVGSILVKSFGPRSQSIFFRAFSQMEESRAKRKAAEEKAAAEAGLAAEMQRQAEEGAKLAKDVCEHLAGQAEERPDQVSFELSAGHTYMKVTVLDSEAFEPSVCHFYRLVNSSLDEFVGHATGRVSATYGSKFGDMLRAAIHAYLRGLGLRA